MSLATFRVEAAKESESRGRQHDNVSMTTSSRYVETSESLSCGISSACTWQSSMPASRPMAIATDLLSPVSMTGVIPRSFNAIMDSWASSRMTSLAEMLHTNVSSMLTKHVVSPIFL